MALIDLWNADQNQITCKRIHQLIAFAGEGRLRDENSTSIEFRTLLKAVSSDVMGQWVESCLEESFNDSGFVLQDAVNEIGRRLGFDVTHGVYRSHSQEGYDGLWQIPGGRAILVESKSSTSFSIKLTRISDYRKQVAPQLNLRPEDISILIVVGTEDTSEFEAQVRGSRFAWEIRLLGVRALYRLLKLKEALDDPKVEHKFRRSCFRKNSLAWIASSTWCSPPPKTLKTLRRRRKSWNPTNLSLKRRQLVSTLPSFPDWRNGLVNRS